MKAGAVLEIACSGEKASRALVSVLTPDNEGGPRGLRISLKPKGKRIYVAMEAESPATVMSTCLAFLRDVALFQEVWLLSQPGQG